jgi:hypothetical protein
LNLANLNNEGKYKTLKMDITFDDSNEFGTFSGIQCIDLIAQKVKELPELKGIIILLKKLLFLHDLNRPYFGIY